MTILYHGSTEIIQSPKILEIQRLLDFGKGFYTTKNKEQAERWAQLKQKREGKNTKAYVTVYIFNETELRQLKIKEFTLADEEWLDFVVKNRNEDYNHGYELVSGPVANDTLYQTLNLYETGILTKPETIARLKVHPLYNQISFHSPKALQLLKYKQAYQVMIG
ncbi:MAG TPA: DUF3990 domain-containing protein [Prolixibacteraceae bacterium]|nr:DUF3990 domain-containing protein [Prolixibacteraceae bacterium]